MNQHPMPEFGSFALLLALMLCAYNLVAGAFSLWASRQGAAPNANAGRVQETARRAGIASFVVVSCAAFALIWAAFTNDYSVGYILNHTNRELNPMYKFSALWSGQEGSLLLWSWLLATYGFVLRLRHKVDVRLSAFAGTILAAVQVFFLLLLNLAAPPFAIQPGDVALDGKGLNPLLQYPEMVIHPPMLYLGYVGFAVPFAFALGALMMRYPGEKWIHITRRWTMVTWMFLTCGIFLGAHWAYSVLGWGGYWGWDPVENASLMPWLTGTAFLHSVMMQEKRGMMKNWNVWLIFSTFMLTLLGTLPDPRRPGQLRARLRGKRHRLLVQSRLMAITLRRLPVYLLPQSRPPEEREHASSRSSAASPASCSTTWCSSPPASQSSGAHSSRCLSEYVNGTKTTVGAPFYNRVNIPIGLFLLMLDRPRSPARLARHFTLRTIRRNFVLPGCGIRHCGWLPLWPAGCAPGPAATIGRPNSSRSSPTHSPPFVAHRHLHLSSCAVPTSVATQTGHEYRLCRDGHPDASRNTRRYGGYLVHFGIVVMFIGIAGGAFNQSHEQEMGFGDETTIGPYRIVCQSYTQDSNANYDTDYALLDVYKGGKKVTQLAPEHRFYHASQTPSTIVALHSTPLSDLYVIFQGRNPDTNKPSIKVFLNPLIAWIWIGVLIVIAGTMFALVPSALARRKESIAAVPAEQLAEVQNA